MKAKDLPLIPESEQKTGNVSCKVLKQAGQKLMIYPDAQFSDYIQTNGKSIKSNIIYLTNHKLTTTYASIQGLKAAV